MRLKRPWQRKAYFCYWSVKAMFSPSRKMDNVDYVNRQGEPVEPPADAVFKHRVGAFVICMAKDRILMLKPQDGQGLWELPGGGLDEGESPEQAVFREVYEETGFDLSNCDLKRIHEQQVYQHIAEQDCFWNYDQIYFLMTGHDMDSCAFPETRKTPEKGEMSWISKDQLQNLPLKNTTAKAMRDLGYLRPSQQPGCKPQNKKKSGPKV
jgi:8-oxo-dGTP pyrophosphatase MutT (NUDIX family)